MTTRIAIVFFCLACAGHARRVLAVGEQAHSKRSNEESPTDSSKSLATLLLALSPEDAFHAPIGGARAPTGAAMGPRGLQASRPMVMGEAQRPSVGDTVKIVGLRMPGWPKVGKIVADDKSDRPYQVEGMYLASNKEESKELCRFSESAVEIDEECIEDEETACPVDYIGIADDCLEEGCPVDKIEELIGLLNKEDPKDLGIQGRIAVDALEEELGKQDPDKKKLSVSVTGLQEMLKRSEDFFKGLSP